MKKSEREVMDEALAVAEEQLQREAAAREIAIQKRLESDEQDAKENDAVDADRAKLEGREQRVDDEKARVDDENFFRSELDRKKRDDEARRDAERRERDSSRSASPAGNTADHGQVVNEEKIKESSTATTKSRDPAPTSFQDAANQSRDANSVAAQRNAKYEQYLRKQSDYDRRIDAARSPLDKERLTNEKELKRHEHLSESKSWLLSQGSSAIGNDQALKERLTNEIADHRKSADELRVQLDPQNYAYHKNEAKVQELRDSTAREGKRDAPESVKEKARENQFQLEQLREKSHLRSQEKESSKTQDRETSQELKHEELIQERRAGRSQEDDSQTVKSARTEKEHTSEQQAQHANESGQEVELKRAPQIVNQEPTPVQQPQPQPQPQLEQEQEEERTR